MKKLNRTNKFVRGAIITATLGMALMLSACGGKKKIALYGTEEEYGTVTLGTYKGIEAEKKVYEITDEAIDSEIEYLLYDYTQYNSVDRGAQEEDFLTLNVKATSAGEIIFDSANEEAGVYETQIGYEDFGTEFDEELTGAKKGDHLSFTVEYGQDFGLENFVGKTVDFDVTIVDVTEESVPELTPEFIKENLEFDSEEALRNDVIQNLTAQYEDTSTYTLYTDLIGKVVANSTVTKYSDKLYDACLATVEQNYLNYAEMLGCETLEEVYEAFGITQEDIQQETIDVVNEEVVINAIATAEKMELSKDEYDKKVENLAEDYEYDSAKEMLEEMGESEVKYAIMEEMVYQFLADNAVLTEVKVDPASEEDEEDMDEEDAEFEMEDMEEGIELDEDELDEIESDEELDEEDAEDALDEEDAEVEDDDEDTADDEDDDEEDEATADDMETTEKLDVTPSAEPSPEPSPEPEYEMPQEANDEGVTVIN